MKILAIWLNAPSNSGASTEHKASHTAVMTSFISLKLNPSALSLSTIPPVSLSNVALTLSHTSSILSLNSSFVSHKCLKAATSAAIIAITARTGAITLEKAPLNVANAAFADAISAGRFDMKVMRLPIVEIVLPSTMRSGPSDAAIRAILIITSFAAGSI